MPPPRKIYADVLLNGVLMFVLPAVVYVGLKAFAPPDADVERRLEQTPEVQRNRANREKLVQVIKPDVPKDEQMRNLLNKGVR